MINYDKPNKSELERINILRSRNVLINQDDEECVARLLKAVSYYTLSNSNKTFYCTPGVSDVYKSDTTIFSLYHAHIVQAHFMNVLLRYILHIEQAFKSHLAESITQSFGVACKTDLNDKEHNYLCKHNYSTKNGLRYNICRSLLEYAENPSPYTTTMYYKKNKNHIPPWILVRDIPFGLLIKWFSILKQRESGYIIDGMTNVHPNIEYSKLDNGDKQNIFLAMIKLLKESRNAIAHGDRLYPYRLNCKLPKNLFLKIAPQSKSWVINHTGDTMAVILSIITLLPNKMLRDLFVLEINNQIMLLRQFDTSPVTLEELLGLPADYANKIQAFAK